MMWQFFYFHFSNFVLNVMEVLQITLGIKAKYLMKGSSWISILRFDHSKY